MKILSDEGIDREIVDQLRSDGADVLYVAELSRGISDEEVLDLAVQQSRLLLTLDKDFGELVFRQRRVSSGVLLVRLSGMKAKEKAGLIAGTVSAHDFELLGSFSVLDSQSLRIRTF